MAGQGQPAPARWSGRAARRVLRWPASTTPPRCAAAPPQRPAPPPRQQAAAPIPGRCPASPSGSSSSGSPSPPPTAPSAPRRYRLITTLTDWRAYPAAALAACYARRWAIETGYAEIKTYLRGPGRILRGRTPDLARQELWAYLAIYQAIRALIARAAAGAGLDPARISFTAALHAARRTLGTDPGALHDALAAAEIEMLSCLVPLREGRICPRAVKKPSLRTHPGATSNGPITQHAEYTITIATTRPARTNHH